MKLTIPHMGYCYIALEALLNEMGHEVILPPECSKNTLNLGTKYSPESACLPLKINVGNFLEAVELGAEGIIMAGGSGPCRFGYYAEVQREILQDLGKDAEIIVLEPPQENFSRLSTQLRRLFAPVGINGFLRGVKIAWAKLKAAEQLEATVRWVRPRAEECNKVNAHLEKSFSKLRQLSHVRDVESFTITEINNLKQFANTNVQPIKIGVVGEIYTVIEPFVNLHLEERLGALGVEVYSTINMVEWVKHHLILNSVNLYSDKSLRKKADGYLRGFVGGHGLETVAHTIMLAEDNYDGVIHILPFTCMPEIVAQSVMSKVSHDYNIPLLTLVVDEHTGETGYQTRLEAFVDLLDRSVKENSYGKETSVPGG